MKVRANSNFISHSRHGGSLERATERCVGVGACRNTKGGVMCPSYRATGDEKHSTRGPCAPAVGDAGRFAARGGIRKRIGA